MAQNHYSDDWILVGQSSKNSMIVRGGENPVAIPVNHNNSGHIMELIADANAGVAARRASDASVKR